MGRLAAVLVLAACVCVSAAQALAPDVGAEGPGASWADAQIRVVVAAGLMGPDLTAFRADEPLTRGELHAALVAAGRPSTAPSDPERPVTMRELDARLVTALGLSESARALRLAARDAGLVPPSHLGTETVARVLGLRVNHPRGREELERQPSETATRAEAAYSLARLLRLGEPELEALRANAGALLLPALTEWQRAVLARAVRFVGYPYVWAGTSERRQTLYYGTMPGGFDCSGFVWRVYKVEPFAAAPLLGEMLRGRTTYAMAGEVAPERRLPLEALAPGDLVFFGGRGSRSAPAEVDHMGIHVGSGWFVHSSGNGVTLQPLEGSYARRFAWGRSPIGEAGLG